MRRVVAATFISLDGVMQAPGAPEEDPSGGFRFGGWTFPYFDEEAGGWIDQTLAKPFDLLLGRRTYEIFAAYWPYQGSNPIAERFNGVTKYVASTSSNLPLTWVKSQLLGPDAVQALAELKRQTGPDLLIQGSSGLIRSLHQHGLVDRFDVMTFPVLLGRGKRLFGENMRPAALRLTDSRTSPSGVRFARYEPVGEVAVGSFATGEPSELELARRKKLAREDA